MSKEIKHAQKDCMIIKEELINQSIDYILKHFHEDISIRDVADNAHFSIYHFSRIFKKVTGESIYAFIKRLKLEQSAVDIKLKKNRALSEIGLNIYQNIEKDSGLAKDEDNSNLEIDCLFRMSLS